MKESDIENLLIRGFQEELKRKKNSHIYQLFMISTRSLLPDLDTGNRINFKRYSEELKLWKYYRVDTNKALDSFIINKRRSQEFDSSSFIRALPIFLTNQNMEIALFESFKISYYITENIESFFFSIINGIILIEYMENSTIENIFNRLKEIIISIPSMEYINLVKKEEDKKYIIEFEQMKINIIQILDRIILDEIDIKDFIDEIFNRVFIDRIDDDIKKSIFKFYKEEITNDSKYIRDIGKYLYKLRLGRINPESLRFNKKNERSIFDIREGERFNNSVLGRSLMSKIEKKDDLEIRYIISKSGKYKFIREI